MNKTHAGRILAVDIRASRLGYAAFETPGRLLDVGVSRFGSPRSARSRVRTLLKRFRPAVLVLDTGTARGPRNQRHASIRKAVRSEARRGSVSIAVISGRTLRNFFAHHGKRNKFDIARLLGTWFPQLVRKVPPKRKCYDPEPWIMSSFDAVALGAAYLELNHSDSEVLSPVPQR